MVEQRTVNPYVARSSRARGAILIMFYQTCNRIGYKLLDPHIWEVFGGEYNTEPLGFTKTMSKTGKFRKCKPPVYEIDSKARDIAKALPTQ